MVFLTASMFWQAHRFFVLQGRASVKIAIQVRNRVEKDSQGMITQSNIPQYHIWATNVGRVRGSYVFVGTVLHLSDAKLKRIRKLGLNSGIIDPAPSVWGYVRSFEVIEPKATSSEISIDVGQILLQYPAGSHVDFCYMDTVGNITKREVVLPGPRYK